MKTITGIIILSLVLSAFAVQAKERIPGGQIIFNNSPRWEYFNNLLSSYFSAHKVVHNMGERISNSLLFRDDILFHIYDCETRKTKFFLARDFSRIIRTLKQKEKQLHLIKAAEEKYGINLSTLEGKVDPLATLWLYKERLGQGKETEGIEIERNFYSALLKDKLRTDDLSDFEDIIDAPYKIFLEIKPGFETEIIERQLELLEWQEQYFSERNSRYPGLSYFVNIPSSLPYVFFSIALPKVHAYQMNELLFQRQKLTLSTPKLKNLYEIERISLSLFYALKRKEALGALLEKINGVNSLSSYFEDFSAVKKMYLDTAFRAEEIDFEIGSLKEELLRYGKASEKEGGRSFFIPDLQETLKHAQDHSLILRSQDIELLFLQRLSAFNRGLIHEYLVSLYAYRKALHEEEMTRLAQKIIGSWYSLVFANESWQRQKERVRLTEEDFILSQDSPTQTSLEKKLKEIAFANQDLELINKEKAVAMSFLSLKEAMGDIEPRQTSALAGQEIRIGAFTDLKSELMGLFSSDLGLKIKKNELEQALHDKELRMIEMRSGRKIFTDKESILKGSVNTPFTLQISQEKLLDRFAPQHVSSAKNFFLLKDKLLFEQGERKNRINTFMLKELEERETYLEKRVCEEEAVLDAFKREPSLEQKQRCLAQSLRVLNKKEELFATMEIYLGEFWDMHETPEANLVPAQEKILLQQLWPVLGRERLEWLNLEKQAEVDLEKAEVYFRLEGNRWLSKNCFGLLKSLQEILKVFSVKAKAGLISREDLSEERLLRDALIGEFSRLKLEWLSLRKKETPSRGIDLSGLPEIDVTAGKDYTSIANNLLKDNPGIRLIDLELEKFSSIGDQDFLKYLRKEKELELKESVKLLSKELDCKSRLASIAKKKGELSVDELRLGFDGLKEDKLWLYGIYGFNSIFLKDLETRKARLGAWLNFKLSLARLSQLLKAPNKDRAFNYQSIIPPNLISGLKTIFLSLKERFIHQPLFARERAKRRESYKMENYKRKSHAFNFYLHEKKTDAALKEKKELFELAHEKEFKMGQYLDQLWGKEEESKDKIKARIKASGIDISQPISFLVASLDIEEKHKEILELFFIQYVKRFGKENFLKKYLENIIYLTKLVSAKAESCDKLPYWWAKYISPILSYPQKSYLEEIIDPRLLGLYLYYAQLMEYRNDENSASFSLRIQRDKEFLFIDLGNISPSKIEDYLTWESEVRKELDRLTLSQWSRQEWENKRVSLAQQAKGRFGFIYGCSKDKVLQEEVVSWLISSGIEENAYPQILSLMEKVGTKIKNSSPTLTRNEKLDLYETVRLRWFLSLGEKQLLEEEESKLDEAIFLGNLLSWTGLFWDNKIGLDEIDLFFSFMEKLKKDPLFEAVFGGYSHLTWSQKKFFVASLSYWAQNWLEEFRKTKDMLLAETNLKERLARFRFIYALEPFQHLYGPMDLSRITMETDAERKRLRAFLGKIGFFLDWTRNFSMDETEVQAFFENLSNLVSLKGFLENIYKNQGINLRLELLDPSDKEETLGILISWLQFFQYRGIRGKNQILQAWEEISLIQQKLQAYNLNLDIDEIRYWWEKAKLKGYALSWLEELFKNISLVKKLHEESCRDLTQRLSSSRLSVWETKSTRKSLIDFVQEKSKLFLERAEVQNFAEKIMPALNISFEDLKNEYTERLYLEACYFVFTEEHASPQKIAQLHAIMKDKGYSLAEMGNFISLFSRFRKEPGLLVSDASDLEVFGFLNYSFTQPPPYEKRISAWLDTASILEGYFYAEHRHYLDFSLLKTLVNYSLLRLRPWQIKRLVGNGALSRMSPDREIREVNPDLDFKRFILRLFWENLGQALSQEDMPKFHEIFRGLNLSESEKRKVFKRLSEKFSLLYNQLRTFIGEILYEKDWRAPELFSTSERVARDIAEETIPYILKHILTQEERIFEERRTSISLKKPAHPYITKKTNAITFDRRKLIEKSIREKAKQIYGLELAPHKSSALVWKVLEGLSVEEALKVYVVDLNRVEKLYKEIFRKESLDFGDTQLMPYFAEEINLGFLSEELMQELFILTAAVKSAFKENLGQDISVQEAIDYAWPCLYSGATPEVIKRISIQAGLIRENIAPLLPQEESSEKILRDILYFLSQIYGIQLVEKIDFPYDKRSYLRAMGMSLDYLGSDKREINNGSLDTAACNLETSLVPPVRILFMANRADYLHNFAKDNAGKEISREEILFYLDFTRKNSLDYLSLVDIYRNLFPAKIGEKKIKDAIDKAFKFFLNKTLNHSLDLQEETGPLAIKKWRFW